MPDLWLIVEASFPGLDGKEIIRKFVKPIVDQFHSQLSTFHFFFEPHLLLRLEAEQNVLTDEVKPYIERKLSDLKATGSSLHFEPGYTEQKDYGEGWKLCKEIFELGARVSIAKVEADSGSIVLGPRFDEATFMHLLLNQCCYSTSTEALLHLVIVGERLAVQLSKNDMGLVNRKFDTISKEIQNTFLPKIADMVTRKLAEP